MGALPALFGILLLLRGSHSATEPYLTLYSERNSQGTSFTLKRGSHYIRNFDDKAKSICGVGVWFLYEDPDYAEKSTFVREFAFGVRTCQDLDSSMSSLVSSARYAGTQDIYEDSLTMYFHGDHKGPEYLVVRDIDFLREVFEDVASSFVITGSSSWTVHEHPDMTGKSACMEPTPETELTCHKV